MPALTRRRFLTISAIAALPLPAQAAQITEWYGTALGSAAAIYLEHPDAAAIIADALAEIERLEAIFSLYRANSALSVLNRTGRLDAPPFELLECLALCGRVHALTSGLFDPTVQPMWQLYAESYANGVPPLDSQIAALLPRIGMELLSYDSESVTLAKGASITLNGVAQGFIADKVAELLAAKGLTDILVNTGEFRALGQKPGGGAWPVKLSSGGMVALTARALATSAPLGTAFDDAGAVGHILDPRTGYPSQAKWRSVSISAPSAALADALTTAACLMPTADGVIAMIGNLSQVRLEALI